MNSTKIEKKAIRTSHRNKTHQIKFHIYDRSLGLTSAAQIKEPRSCVEETGERERQIGPFYDGFLSLSLSPSSCQLHRKGGSRFALHSTGQTKSDLQTFVKSESCSLY